MGGSIGGFAGFLKHNAHRENVRKRRKHVTSKQMQLNAPKSGLTMNNALLRLHLLNKG